MTSEREALDLNRADSSTLLSPLGRRIAIANQKGGVGKTTTVVNLGAALAEMGREVVVVDLDPQANATTAIGLDPRSPGNTVYDMLVQKVPVRECLSITEQEHLCCIPSHLDLAGAEVELVSMLARESQLSTALESLTHLYDYVLIDCPPSLGLLTINALVAVTEVITPIQCEYFALEGLGALIQNVNLVKQRVNPSLDFTGFVLTMFDPRTNLSTQVVNEVRNHLAGKVFNTIVPRSVRLSEAPSFGQPIGVYSPTSRGAIAYRDLALEVDQRYDTTNRSR